MYNSSELLASTTSNAAAYDDAQPKPALPWEVIERVIDQSSEHVLSLRNFALTCHQLYPRSIFALFYNAKLESRKQIFAFCDVLQAKHELRPIVDTLSIHVEEFAPFPLLSLLPSLRSLTLYASEETDEYPGVISTHESILHCCRQHGQGIRSLTFRGVWFTGCTSFIRFISAFSNLQELMCNDVRTIGDQDINPSDILMKHPPSRRIALNMLTVRTIAIIPPCSTNLLCIDCI